jgi:hypothetical protein
MMMLCVVTDTKLRIFLNRFIYTPERNKLRKDLSSL